MADTTIRIQRWDNGVLVEDYTVPKPVEQFNEETITERAEQALVNNLAYLASTPTQTDAIAQVDDLTRQVNAIIRLVLQRFDSAE